MNGKSWYIWMVKEVLEGNINPGNIVYAAKQNGVSSIFVKIANGTSRYNLRPPLWTDDILPALVDACHTAGIKVYGWHYIYGVDPLGEARLGAKRSLDLKLDGYVIDAEAEFKAAGMGLKATTYMNELRAQLPNLPIGLATYRYPSCHPEFPWAEFVGSGKLDFHMPQVYWVKATNPADQLVKCVGEYRGMETKYGIKPLPIIPIGAAYREFLPDGSWQPTPEQIQTYHTKVLELSLPGESFWEWGSAIKYGFESVVHALVWPAPSAEKTLEERTAELERKAAELAARDVQLDAASVEAARLTGIRLDMVETTAADLVTKFAFHEKVVSSRLDEMRVENSETLDQLNNFKVDVYKRVPVIETFVQKVTDWIKQF